MQRDRENRARLKLKSSHHVRRLYPKRNWLEFCKRLECKNYKSKVGVELIDAFIGKLQDIGAATKLGVIVTTVGFTEDAVARAKTAGISTLLINGLEDDRLSIKVIDILSTIIFWFASWKTTSSSPVPGRASEEAVVLTNMPPDQPWATTSLDALWQLWLRDVIPMQLGEHTVELDRGEKGIAWCEVHVTAHSFVNQGERSITGLRDAKSGQTVVSHTNITTPSQSEPKMVLRPHITEDSLNSMMSTTQVVLNVKVPRFIGPSLYWPPSEESVEKLMKLRRQGKPVNFWEVEGTNLYKAWY